MHSWFTNPSDLFRPKSFKKNLRHKNTLFTTFIDHPSVPHMRLKVEISKERLLKYFPPFLKSQKRDIWNTFLLLPAWLHEGILWIRCTQSTRERVVQVTKWIWEEKYKYKQKYKYRNRTIRIQKKTHMNIHTITQSTWERVVQVSDEYRNQIGLRFNTLRVQAL